MMPTILPVALQLVGGVYDLHVTAEEWENAHMSC